MVPGPRAGALVVVFAGSFVEPCTPRVRLPMVFIRRVVVAGVALVAGIAACSSAHGQKSHQFDNNAAITIPALGNATPYPSTITVSGINAPIGEVKVVLRGLNHGDKRGLSILLVGPAENGGNVLLMGRVGNSNGAPTPHTYIIAQGAPPFPILADPADGRYAPTRDTNFTPGLGAPAPAGAYGETLNVFKGGLANGTWSLYIVDQFTNNAGTLAGWSLVIDEAPTAAARGAITIPGGAPGTTIGVASPYPAPVLVDGVVGPVQTVRVMLHGFSHTYNIDVRMILQGPAGQTCQLLSRCGEDGPTPPPPGVDLIFDDAAAGFLPYGVPTVSGAYKPSACFVHGDFPAPAPVGPYAPALSVFTGTNPNGVWNLWIEDYVFGDSGQLAGGWSLIVNDKVCKADFNGVGGVTIDDLFLYINAYFTGCP